LIYQVERHLFTVEPFIFQINKTPTDKKYQYHPQAPLGLGAFFSAPVSALVLSKIYSLRIDCKNEKVLFSGVFGLPVDPRALVQVQYYPPTKNPVGVRLTGFFLF